MRTSELTLTVALTLAPGIAFAQGSWGNVKSWIGSVTIEATDTRSGGGVTSRMTYKATGDFKISDEMMPAGSHMQWPMPGVETLSDPKQAETATIAGRPASWPATPRTGSTKAGSLSRSRALPTTGRRRGLV